MILSLSLSSVASAAARHRAVVAIAGTLVAALPFPVAGVGLGEITQQSALGQSLRVVVPVTLGPGEELPAECFKLTTAEREGDGVPQLLFGRVNLERTPAGATLVVTNVRPVNDPVVRITVQAGCESAVRREYTLFMDPPPIEVPVVAAESALPATTQAPPPQPAPRESRRTTRTQARAATRTATGSATAPTSDPGAEPARKAAPTKGRPATKAATKPPPAIATERPRFSVSSGSPGTPSGAAATEADRERARQERANAIEAETQVLRQRIVELTAIVERMQQELRAQEVAEQAAEAAKSAAAMPAGAAPPAAAASAAAPAPTPPDAAKAEPPAPSTPKGSEAAPDWWDDNAPLVAAIIGLGLLIAAGLLWKRRRDTTQDDQWRTVRASIREAQGLDTPVSVLRNPTAGIAMPGPPGPQIAAPAVARETEAPGRESIDALAVSELSHVTEEARVFRALGHNERAIEVLHEHIGRSPRSMPAAWLMLLDLYHATDNRSDFRDLADAFHTHFNVEAPPWEAFGSDEAIITGGIEGFPHVEQQIVALWRKPGCRGYLERLLHDNREGRRNGFPLQAYADILLLLQVLDSPVDVDIDGDLAAAGKLDPKPKAAPVRATATTTSARARKPPPPDPGSHTTQQPIRFEIEPRDAGPNTKS